MKKTMLFALLLASILVILPVYADGLSLQLKRTNPGIAGEKSAEIIFDIVNTDLTHKIEGFIWCKSPDDATISSTLGAASGSGAQYVSQKFFMDEGPSQKSMSLTVESGTKGDKNTGCFLKYIPYKESLKTVVVVENVNGTEVNTTTEKSEREYLKMNGEYVSEATDEIYREIRLDKTVPFVKGMANPECPEGQETCKASDVKGDSIKTEHIIAAVIILAIVVLIVIFVFMRRPRPQGA